jgi:hypothetical protein
MQKSADSQRQGRKAEPGPNITTLYNRAATKVVQAPYQVEPGDAFDGL